MHIVFHTATTIILIVLLDDVHFILSFDNRVRELLAEHANVVAEISKRLGAGTNDRLGHRRTEVPRCRARDTPDTQAWYNTPYVLKNSYIFFITRLIKPTYPIDFSFPMKIFNLYL